MSTESTSNDMRHRITVVNGDEKTVIRIELNDECRNGHEDFSMTADIYEKTPRGAWRDAGGGCCHEHILKLRPDLEIFARLHLCTHEGVPMHGAADAWFWFQGAFPESVDYSANLGPCHGGTGRGAKSPEECRRILAEHIRASDAQIEQLRAMLPRSEVELAAALEDCGFLAQWKAEAQTAIALLEQWTGKTFESRATRGFWVKVSDENRALIADRKASGYYSPEQVAARDAERVRKEKERRISEIVADFEGRKEKARREMLVALYFAERFSGPVNVIYYDFNNTLSFNWTSTEKLISRADYEEIIAKLDRSALPEGIQTEWKAAPKY